MTDFNIGDAILNSGDFQDYIEKTLKEELAKAEDFKCSNCGKPLTVKEINADNLNKCTDCKNR